METFTGIKKIAIISDTHDFIPCILKFIDYINSHPIDLVLHAGDFCSLKAMIPFQKLKVPFIGILGNMDTDPKMEKFLTKKNIFITQSPACFFINDKKIFLAHNIQKHSKELKKEKPDIIVHGHTHIAQVTHDPVLMINPGEACGIYLGKPTMLVLTMKTLKTEFIPLN